ncbi:MAG: hypothetical protein Q8P29_01370, partial [Candidatus Levybacteria bacterium]|nr:hypothetical protein [Candidatus Levybacteria bacterium]
GTIAAPFTLAGSEDPVFSKVATLLVKDPSKKEPIIKATIRILFVDLSFSTSEVIDVLYRHLKLIVNYQNG